VKAHAHAAQSEVTVLTGRVIVTHPEDHDDNLYQKLISSKKEVELTPNYKAVYSEAGHSLLVTIADDPVPLTRPDGGRGGFDFNNAAVRDVLASLEGVYGIRIRSGADIDRCTFTGDLSGQDLYERLDLICQAIGANYTRGGTDIIMSGGNCE
jgi:hypothetical protein